MELLEARPASDRTVLVSALIEVGRLTPDESTGVKCLDDAISMANDLNSIELKAEALILRAWYAFGKGDAQLEERMADEALALAESSGLPRLLGRALRRKGTSAADNARIPEARLYYVEALRWLREEGDRSEEAFVLADFANAELQAGDHEAARRLYGEALTIASQMGNVFFQAIVHCGLAEIELSCDNLTKVYPHLEFALGVLAKGMGSDDLLAYTLLDVAVRAALEADLQLGAAELLGASQATFDRMGFSCEASEAVVRDTVIVQLQETLGENFESAFQAGRKLVSGDAIALASSVLNRCRS